MDKELDIQRWRPKAVHNVKVKILSHDSVEQKNQIRQKQFDASLGSDG